MSRELDRLKADVAALKADNTALRAENAVLRNECQALRDECQTLRAEVLTLKEQLAKNSRNSSKPPSSDGLAKPKPKSLRPHGERPPGGQEGHPGQTLRMVDKPDHTVPHLVNRCEGCGCSLAGQAPDRIERRQVFDIPEPKLEVTEHQAEIKTCACGHVNRAAFPPEAAAPVQYGPRVKSIAVYLKDYQLLPFERHTEIMRDLFACDTFSQGTLANLGAECSRRLEPVDDIIRAQAANAAVAGFDETGLRLSVPADTANNGDPERAGASPASPAPAGAKGALHWLHAVSTEWLTWYFAHPKRGSEAMDEAGVLPDFRGRAVHDFWEPYLKYDCTHAFCNAHLLRELVFLFEEQHQAWAKVMIEHLLAIKAAVDTARQAGAAALPGAELERFTARYFQIVVAGYDENPAAPEPETAAKRRGRRKQSKARNLLDRFRNRADGILAFMYDFSIPFDNNLSERDLRMMKLRQKISGTFRSLEALAGFCRIRGYVSTARKNGVQALDALRRVFAGAPFLPPAPAQT
jgi:transposase